MTFYNGIQIENLAKSLLSFEDKKENPTTEEITAKIAVIKLNMLRGERNQRLIDSDWVVVNAAETGGTVSDAWKTYRQALRDLPANTSDPENPTWPTKPE